MQIPNIHALCGIWTHDPGFRASEDSPYLRPRGYRDWQPVKLRAQANIEVGRETAKSICCSAVFIVDEAFGA
jgi:hypothetical protein